eukprot:2367728-Amphidinium_carterae.1
MDDVVLVEPAIGNRPTLSAQQYELAVGRLLGKGAINADKAAAEGTFHHEATIWGLVMNTKQNSIRVPEKRLLKGAYLLTSPCFEVGNKRIALRDMQRLRGTAQSWLPAVPSLQLELGVLDCFMHYVDEHWVRPNCTPGAEEHWWNELWRTLEAMKLLLTQPETWAGHFRSMLENMVDIGERLALPHMRSRVVHVSSDATPLHHAAVDWKYKVAARSEVHPYLEAMKRLLSADGDCEEETGIAIAELLSIVTFAAQRGPQWRQQIILYAGDNEN